MKPEKCALETEKQVFQIVICDPSINLMGLCLHLLTKENGIHQKLLDCATCNKGKYDFVKTFCSYTRSMYQIMTQNVFLTMEHDTKKFGSSYSRDLGLVPQDPKAECFQQSSAPTHNLFA